jgi:hypothetical protein
MPTITATPDTAKTLVRLDLDFSDIDAAYAYVTRVDPTTGATTPVRGHGIPATIGALPYAPMQAGFKAVLYDAEAPLDAAVYYVATAPSAALNVTTAFTGGYIDPWYSDTPSQVQIRITASATSPSAANNFLTFNVPGGSTATPTIRAEDIPATPGASITITASVSATASQGVTVGLAFRDSTGAILSSPGTTATVLAATTITATATAPANTVSVQPYVLMTGTPAFTTFASIGSLTVTNVAGTATSAGVLLPSLGAARLKDPLRPGNNVRVDLAFDPNPLCTPSEGIFWQSLDTEQQGANAATFNVNNQANPVVVSKVRSSVTSTLVLVTRTFQDRDRLIALLAPGSPLLFQCPDEFGVPDRYIAVGDESVFRALPDHRFPIRIVSMPHAVVSSPGGPMQGAVGARWSDTCNRYASWSAVNAASLTWTQILDGLAG